MGNIRSVYASQRISIPKTLVSVIHLPNEGIGLDSFFLTKNLCFDYIAERSRAWTLESDCLSLHLGCMISEQFDLGECL